MLALQRGDISQIHIYLDGGVPVDYSFEDGDSTPLIIAASNDQPVVVSLLIQLGANVNARDKGEYAPLHWAAFYGHATVASLLLKNGADIDAQQNTGATPLYLAVIRNKTSMVELLLRHGADTKLRSVDGSPLDVALKKEQNDIIKLLLG
jgi:ankyrin repeat protein